MIYYFSGTGNSYAVAKKLAEALGEELTGYCRSGQSRQLQAYYATGGEIGLCLSRLCMGSSADGDGFREKSGALLQR